ncbi:MAG TPA: hypothetical protein VHJ20_13015, partial [Polyangia bacterium]|nr:hypothetical protein [Polyangia bacterium]
GRAVLVEGAAAGAAWSALAELPAAHAADVRVRVGARSHDLPDLLAALELDRAAAGVAVRAALGLAYVSLANVTDGAALLPTLGRWQRLAAARGGYVVVEAAPLALASRAALPFGSATGSAAALGRSLVQSWDPRGTINQGRVPWT